MKNNLKLTFKTDRDQTYSLSFMNVNPDIENIVNAVMDEIIAAEAVEETKGKLLEKVDAVLYQEKKTDIPLS